MVYNACVRSWGSLGHGAFVDLEAVVVKDVPSYAIVSGNPARVLCYRFTKDVIGKLRRIRWWELNMQYLKGIDFSEKNNKCFGTFVLQSKTLHKIGA